MTGEPVKNIFIPGAISPVFIGDSIARHNTKTDAGAHSIFLGQIRKDRQESKTVAAIEYSAYEEMALEKVQEMREVIIIKHSLTCLHIYHSLGLVKVGEICLFIFTSAPHRKAAIDACGEVVEYIKKELPVWGRIIFDDAFSRWKNN